MHLVGTVGEAQRARLRVEERKRNVVADPRRAERLNAKLHFAMGEEAEERRQRAYALMKEFKELNPDIAGLAPWVR